MSENRLKEIIQEKDTYQNILQEIEDGYSECDLSGRIEVFNPAFCNILGYPPDEMLGVSYEAYLDEENADKAYKAFNELNLQSIHHKIKKE